MEMGRLPQTRSEAVVCESFTFRSDFILELTFLVLCQISSLFVKQSKKQQINSFDSTLFTMKFHRSFLLMNLAATAVHVGLTVEKVSLVDLWKQHEPSIRRFAATMMESRYSAVPTDAEVGVSSVLEPALQAMRNITPCDMIPIEHPGEPYIYVELAPPIIVKEETHDEDPANEDNEETNEKSMEATTTLATVRDWFYRALKGSQDSPMPSFKDWFYVQTQPPPLNNVTAAMTNSTNSSAGLSFAFATDIDALGFVDFRFSTITQLVNETRYSADQVIWNTATNVTHASIETTQALVESATHYSAQVLATVHSLWGTVKTATQRSISHSATFLHARFTTLVINPAANLVHWTTSLPKKFFTYTFTNAKGSSGNRSSLRKSARSSPVDKKTKKNTQRPASKPANAHAYNKTDNTKKTADNFATRSLSYLYNLWLYIVVIARLMEAFIRLVAIPFVRNVVDLIITKGHYLYYMFLSVVWLSYGAGTVLTIMIQNFVGFANDSLAHWVAACFAHTLVIAVVYVFYVRKWIRWFFAARRQPYQPRRRQGRGPSASRTTDNNQGNRWNLFSFGTRRNAPQRPEQNQGNNGNGWNFFSFGNGNNHTTDHSAPRRPQQNQGNRSTNRRRNASRRTQGRRQGNPAPNNQARTQRPSFDGGNGFMGGVGVGYDFTSGTFTFDFNGYNSDEHGDYGEEREFHFDGENVHEAEDEGPRVNDAGASPSRPERPTNRDYRVLGVASNAPFAECKRKYRTLIRRLHPDRNGGRQAHEETARVNDAYHRIEDWDKYCRGEWTV